MTVLRNHTESKNTNAFSCAIVIHKYRNIYRYTIFKCVCVWDAAAGHKPSFRVPKHFSMFHLLHLGSDYFSFVSAGIKTSELQKTNISSNNYKILKFKYIYGLKFSNNLIIIVEHVMRIFRKLSYLIQSKSKYYHFLSVIRRRKFLYFQRKMPSYIVSI